MVSGLKRRNRVNHEETKNLDISDDDAYFFICRDVALKVKMLVEYTHRFL